MLKFENHGSQRVTCPTNLSCYLGKYLLSTTNHPFLYFLSFFNFFLDKLFQLYFSSGYIIVYINLYIYSFFIFAMEYHYFLRVWWLYTIIFSAELSQIWVRITLKFSKPFLITPVSFLAYTYTGACTSMRRQNYQGVQLLKFFCEPTQDIMLCTCINTQTSRNMNISKKVECQ